MSKVPKSMQAAYINELGPPEVIRIGELPVPHYGPTDVLIEVQYLTVNPVDGFIRSGAYRTPTPFPFIVGRDVVGKVVACGEGAAGFSVGDLVWCNSLGHGGRQGPFAEYAVVPVERLYHLPPGVDPKRAVAVFHPMVTAWLGLYRHAGLQAGETVFVGGGAGNVGTAVIQLAAAAGARVIASARAEDAEWCQEAGADTVFDYRDPNLGEALRKAAPEGIDLYWDTSGRHDLDLAVGLLARGGRLVLMAGLNEQPVLPVGKLYTRDASIVGFALSNAGVSDLSRAAAAINRMLTLDHLKVRIAGEMRLAETAEAHRLVAGGQRGRLILRP